MRKVITLNIINNINLYITFIYKFKHITCKYNYKLIK